MELNIGANIKKLRLARGMTQEQLADLLNVSSAAISKWEAKSTYPDISMLFPLANIFGVSTDELLGYDAVKMQREIEKLIEEYQLHHMNGEFEKAHSLIEEARRTYPNDYLIMNTYMWNKAGGVVDNRPDILLENQNEFTQICDCILDGCSEERLRLDALNMKAKLFHAAGDTDGALKILDKFPSVGNCAEWKTEQLFAKNTPEFKYWLRKNTYGLFDVTAYKWAKMIWFDDTFSVQERIDEIEAIGDSFTAMRKNGIKAAVVSERMIYAELANRMSLVKKIDDIIDDIVRIRSKQFTATKAMMELSEKDNILKELIVKTYKPYQTDNMLKWIVDWLLNAQYPYIARLRNHKKYMDMLLKWNEET